MKYKLEYAKQEHIREIVHVFRRSRAEILTFLPQLHSKEDDIAYFREEVWSTNKIVVALNKDTIIGFIAYQKEHINHLYILPEYVGTGIGKSLLDKVKESYQKLDLWVFQDNKNAIGFYVSNGFEVIKESDGQMNEEKLPDFLMAWSERL